MTFGTLVCTYSNAKQIQNGDVTAYMEISMLHLTLAQSDHEPEVFCPC